MKGECKFKDKIGIEEWCCFHSQFLTPTSCEGCTDYLEEDEEIPPYQNPDKERV
jgi:hypothetical protein